MPILTETQFHLTEQACPACRSDIQFDNREEETVCPHCLALLRLDWDVDGLTLNQLEPR